MHVVALTLAALAALCKGVRLPQSHITDVHSCDHQRSLPLEVASRQRDRCTVVSIPVNESSVAHGRRLKRFSGKRMASAVMKTFPPPRPSPPRDGLRWAQSGGGAVAVVDLGDAARWLLALHRHAWAPVLLWSAADESRRHPPPPWLERQPAYLLAALSARRIREFLMRDTTDAVPDRLLGMLETKQLRQLMLNSAAPTVLSVLEPEFAKISEEDLILIRALRHFHRTFRGLVLRQDASGKTQGQAYCSKHVQFNDWCQSYNCTFAAHLVAEKCAEDANGEMVTIALPERHRGHYVPMQPDIHILSAIQRRFNISLRMTRLDPKMRGSPRMATLIAATAFGEVHLLALPLTVRHPLASLEMIQAAGGTVRLLLAVPPARVRTGWSRVTRAFGGNAGAVAMAAAAAFVLAWRDSEREWSPAENAHRRPHRRRLRRRLSTALLLMVSILLFVVGQSLFRYIQKSGPGLEQPFNTIQQLMASGHPIVTMEQDAAGFNSRFRFQPVNESTMNRMMYKEVPPAIAVWDNQWPEWKTERFRGRKMHVLREYVEEAFSTWHATPNWPWVDSVNKFILFLTSIGLRDFWQKEYIKVLALWSGRYGYFDYSLYAGPRVLDVSDIVPFLEALGAGLALAALSFFVELLFCRKRAARLREEAVLARAARAALLASQSEPPAPAPTPALPAPTTPPAPPTTPGIPTTPIPTAASYSHAQSLTPNQLAVPPPAPPGTPSPPALTGHVTPIASPVPPTQNALLTPPPPYSSPTPFGSHGQLTLPGPTTAPSFPASGIPTASLTDPYHSNQTYQPNQPGTPAPPASPAPPIPPPPPMPQYLTGDHNTLYPPYLPGHPYQHAPPSVPPSPYMYVPSTVSLPPAPSAPPSAPMLEMPPIPPAPPLPAPLATPGPPAQAPGWPSNVTGQPVSGDGTSPPSVNVEYPAEAQGLYPSLARFR